MSMHTILLGGVLCGAAALAVGCNDTPFNNSKSQMTQYERYAVLRGEEPHANPDRDEPDLRERLKPLDQP
jgi:hypothetical protein